MGELDEQMIVIDTALVCESLSTAFKAVADASQSRGAGPAQQTGFEYAGGD
jgi:hypothetical protein